MFKTKQKSNWVLRADGYHRNESSHTATRTPNPNWITTASIDPEYWRRADGTIDWNGYYEERRKVGLSK